MCLHRVRGRLLYQPCWCAVWISVAGNNNRHGFNTVSCRARLCAVPGRNQTAISSSFLLVKISVHSAAHFYAPLFFMLLTPINCPVHAPQEYVDLYGLFITLLGD